MPTGQSVPPVVHLDTQAVRLRQLLGHHTDLGTAQVEMRRLLDEIANHVTDPIARQAVETARTALGVLDAIKVHYPPPRPAPPPRRGFLGGLLGGPEEPEPPRTPEVRVNLDRLLSSVRDALEDAQRLQKQAEPPPPQVIDRPWHDDVELMTLVQDLLAGLRRKTPDYLKARVEQLGEDLSRRPHEIEVVEFDGTNRSQFTIAPSNRHEGTGAHTTRPALQHGGRLLLAGEAREPITTDNGRTAS